MKISEIENTRIKIGGRTVHNLDPVTLVWTGSYVEFLVKASEFKILIEGPYDTYENWIAIELNGEIISRRMVSREQEWITVFRMHNPENETSIKIIKEVQAFSSDANHRLNIYAIETDGQLLEVKEKPYKIEFIGDSITSAEGCVGAKCEMDWVSGVFSHVNSYPYMIGKKLNADIRVFSQSGFGTYCSWDCNTDGAIPKYYEDVCSVMAPGFFDKNGFYDKWDFMKWQPDAVVINLGTNDDGAFHNNECENANLLKMVNDEYVEEDRQKVRDTMVDFLKKVRDNNPDAYIGWAFGMIGDKMEPTILEAIQLYQNDYHDSNIGYIKLSEVTDKTIGSRCHPGKKAHKEAAKVLSSELKKKLKSLQG